MLLSEMILLSPIKLKQESNSRTPVKVHLNCVGNRRLSYDEFSDLLKKMNEEILIQEFRVFESFRFEIG